MLSTKLLAHSIHSVHEHLMERVSYSLTRYFIHVHVSHLARSPDNSELTESQLTERLD